ncbi:TPA: fimbrial protein [Citrobacter werkmanii]
MSRGWLTGLLLLGLSLAGQAAAVECYYGNAGGQVQVTVPLEGIAVPADARAGQKIWQSSDYKVPVYCGSHQAVDFSKSELFVWLNPRAGMVADSVYQLGVSYEGRDYDLSGSPVGIDTGNCVDDERLAAASPDEIIRHGLEPRLCSGHASDVHTSRRFLARFRVYVRLKRLPPANYTSQLQSATVLQFDGSSRTSGAGKNLQYLVSGLDNIRALDCSVTLTMSPDDQVIDFGEFSAADVIRNNRIQRFSIRSQRRQDMTCSDGFRLNAAFSSDQPLSAGDSALLFGNGLQLQLLTGNGPAIFNRYSAFADFTAGQLSHEQTYQAQLSRVAGDDIHPGPFSAVVILKINYN